MHNNRNSKKILNELNLSYTYKNLLNSHTIDSTRMNNNKTPLLNDNSYLYKKKEDKSNKKQNKKNNELYQKSINGLADEVMKPSFLKSDVSMTMLQNNYNNGNNNMISNNKSTDSFTFLNKNKMKKNKQSESYSFVEIQNSLKRNSSPFNKDRKNNNNLNRNRSFLY